MTIQITDPGLLERLRFAAEYAKQKSVGPIRVRLELRTAGIVVLATYGLTDERGLLVGSSDTYGRLVEWDLVAEGRTNYLVAAIDLTVAMHSRPEADDNG
jgi:hypothetical protein